MSIFEKYVAECLAVGFEYVGRGSRERYSKVKCMVCWAIGEYRQDAIRRGYVRCKTCYETKMREECSAAGFTWIEKVDGNYSKCSCDVCGHVDEYAQCAIRRGEVRCKACHETKIREECSAEGFLYLGKSSRVNYSVVKCMVCGSECEYQQDAIRRGEVRCKTCYETKMREECSAAGFTWIEKVDKHYSKCSCDVCGHVDEYAQCAIRSGNVRCSNCQIIGYKSASKPDWVFVDHFRDGRRTYVNIKHSCGDALVKVQVGSYLKGEYSCPHCMHTHFNDPSYFYVIQVENIIKLGISNRPDQRYTQYGLPDDSEIIEHLRIPLETKRDALVVESHAKQVVKDFKIPPDIAKQVFTKEGFNECYSLESLDLLLTI